MKKFFVNLLDWHVRYEDDVVPWLDDNVGTEWVDWAIRMDLNKDIIIEIKEEKSATLFYMRFSEMVYSVK